MSGNKKKARPVGQHRSRTRTDAQPGEMAVGAVGAPSSLDGITAETGAVAGELGDTQSTPASPTSATSLRWIRLSLVGLAFAGFLIAFYLTLTHYRNIIPPCYGTSGCEEVITSRYAVILGIPLSLVGVAYFGVMFYLGIALLTTSRTAVLRAYELLAYAGLLAAICLFLLQALVLKAYCTYCLTTEVIALLMWGGSFALTSAARRGGTTP